MKFEWCAQCGRNVSLCQTDLCKECLKEKFKDLISTIDKIRPLHPKLSQFYNPKEPKGAA
ncbi:hypothetical protein JWG44_03695 [Leptospira sp. 201903071]|nr:hypothetical protein [Leptospira ainazelensis]MBM9499349.1 hypothetical protein [Leptospira ainazelensis]